MAYWYEANNIVIYAWRLDTDTPYFCSSAQPDQIGSSFLLAEARAFEALPISMNLAINKCLIQLCTMCAQFYNIESPIPLPSPDGFSMGY